MSHDAVSTGLPDRARVAVLVNPAARATGDRRSIANATRLLSQRYVVDTRTPASIDDLEAVARDAASSSHAVVVAGGDGTLYRVINAIAGAPIPIGLLPLGTGNDLARALGIPADPEGAARRVLDGQCRRIDLVEVNGRLFCTVGVIGLGSAATLAYNRLLKPGSWTRPLMRVFGGWAYRIAGLQVMLRPGSLLLQVRIGTGTTSDSGASRAVLGLFVTNATSLGSAMTLPIDSAIDDGRLEVVWVGPMSRPRLLWAFACLANGWRLPEGSIDSVQADRGVITCDRSVTFTADGEVVCEATRFDVAVRLGALTVVC